MGEQTDIEWADHTFNPWIGCAKVSPGCAHCYAERFGKRVGVAWGGERRMTSPSTWAQPRRWNRQAYENREAWMAGVRPRVFCGSLCDVFDPAADDDLRCQLFTLIHDCPNLIWLLLTKRPQVAAEWMQRYGGMSRTDHVWIGTSVENQQVAEERIPWLLRVPHVAGHFLSCEPLLGPVGLRRLSVPVTSDAPPGPHNPPLRLDALTGDHWLPSGRDRMGPRGPRIDWVIAGGESGPKARPMHPYWARSLRDQCQDAVVPFFFKQWGEWSPIEDDDALVGEFHQGGDWIDGCICAKGDGPLYRIGKKRAGRLLDGRTWEEVPAWQS